MGIVSPIGSPKPLYNRPELLSADHCVEHFGCGKEPLDDWLRAQVLEQDKARHTFVITSRAGEAAGHVVAYYSITPGTVALQNVPKKFRRGLPNPSPAMVLSRLAVDVNHSRRGLGTAMVREAMQRTLQVAETAGFRAIILQAIDRDAMSFYARLGFQVFPSFTQSMYLPIETIAEAIRTSDR